MADTAGQTVSLSSLRGKAVLVTFWATWCDSCQEEFPALDALYKRHRAAGFAILAPSMDAGGRKAVLPFAARLGTSFPILLADPASAAAYGVRGLPTAWLVRPDGVLEKKYVGPVDPVQLENDILRIIPRRS